MSPLLPITIGFVATFALLWALDRYRRRKRPKKTQHVGPVDYGQKAREYADETRAKALDHICTQANTIAGTDEHGQQPRGSNAGQPNLPKDYDPNWRQTVDKRRKREKRWQWLRIWLCVFGHAWKEISILDMWQCERCGKTLSGPKYWRAKFKKEKVNDERRK